MKQDNKRLSSEKHERDYVKRVAKNHLIILRNDKVELKITRSQLKRILLYVVKN
jgi:hypothetical protein